MSGRRFRNVVFTSFADDIAGNLEEKKDWISYCIYQREECPETKRHHWQGYLELSGQKSFRQLKVLLGDSAHIEPRRGSAYDAAEYCRKLDSAIPGTQVEWGEISNPGKRSDLKECMEMVMRGAADSEIIERFPGTWCRNHKGLTAARTVKIRSSVPAWREVKVIVMYGPTGTGKTRACYQKDPDLYSLPIPANNSLWFDGYRGERTLLLDDFTGWIKHAFLLRILDGYKIDLPVKGGFVSAAWTQVFITSNRHPSEWYSKHGLRPELIRRIRECWRMEDTVTNKVNLVPLFGQVPFSD